MKTPITTEQLLRAEAPARAQREFEIQVRAAQHPEDSAAGDREIRETVAESFAARWNKQT